MIVICLAALSSLSGLRAEQQHVDERALVPLAAVSEVRRAYLQTRVDRLTDFWIDNQDGKAEQAYRADVEAMDAAIERLQQVAATPVQREQAAALETAWRAYVSATDDPAFKQAARTDDLAAYTAIRDEKVTPNAAAIQEATELISADVQAQATQGLAYTDASFTSSRRILLLALGVALVAAGALALVATRSVTRPLRKLGEVCAAVAAGDLTRTASMTGTDEVCRVAQALDKATAATRQTVTLLASGATSITGTTDELAAVAQQIAGAAQDTSARAAVARQAASDVALGVQSVAAGAEQMSASIQEIARNASQAAQLGNHARSLAENTTTTMAKLGDSSAGIGNVIQVITTIAEQTNLLALNATIEAARAGEAGRGFAVVASEVKDLAQETARATKEIGELVETIQLDSAGAVDAIAKISEVIAQLDLVQSTIASAVEEQSATTSEMSRSVAEASDRTADIVNNVAAVATSADQTTSSLDTANTAVASLGSMAGDLDEAVRRFTH